MQPRFLSRSIHGFTLIELLIVVIIVAILAAVVIPQFQNTSGEARESSLDANLSALRSASELYKLQHRNNYPGATASSGGTGCTGATGTGAAGSAQAFIDQMTMASNADGATCTIADANYRFGPYLKRAIPNEPISGRGSVATEIAITTTGAPIVPIANTGGWAIDTVSGQIVANSNANDSNGRPRFTR